MCELRSWFDGSRLRGDDRAVSTTVGYVLTLAITSIIISGVLMAGGHYIDEQRESVARDELRVVGDQLAAGITDADRLAGSSNGGDIRVRVWLPERVVTAPYTLRITNRASPPGEPWTSVISAHSDAADVTMNVTVRTSFQVAERTVKGGPVTIVYRNVDDDEARELVINKTTMTVAQPEPSNLGHREIVYLSAETGELSSVTPSGDVTRYGVSDVQAIGPKEVDFDGDGLREIPYVNSAGDVKLIDENGQTQTLATGADTSKTLLGVGFWKGEYQVFYVSAGEHEIYRVSPGDPPVQVDDGGLDLAAYAVAGVMDFNRDGDQDIVYSNSNQQIYYLDGGGRHKGTNGGLGQNNGIGLGAPRDFDGDGKTRLPIVDGSNNVMLYVEATGKTDIGDNAAKSPLAGIQWNTTHSGLEVVYIHKSDSTLYYVTSDGAYVTQIIASDGTAIQVDTAVGVA